MTWGSPGVEAMRQRLAEVKVERDILRYRVRALEAEIALLKQNETQDDSSIMREDLEQ